MNDSKTVYYFGTCLGDMVYSQGALAGFKLLKEAGLEVVFPLEQSCCGQPAYNSGFHQEAMKVARAQLKAFPNENWPIIVPSGSCAGMMKVHYPEMFKNDDCYQKALSFSQRVFELGEYLANILKIKYEDQGEPIKVTWHSCCHAIREAKCIEADKTLIRSLKNVTLVELEREDECCGFGGTFAVKRPEVSGKMVSDKIDDVLSTGAQLLISSDCGCLMNISGAMEKKGISLKTQYMAEFIWERTRKEGK